MRRQGQSRGRVLVPVSGHLKNGRVGGMCWLCLDCMLVHVAPCCGVSTPMYSCCDPSWALDAFRINVTNHIALWCASTPARVGTVPLSRRSGHAVITRTRRRDHPCERHRNISQSPSHDVSRADNNRLSATFGPARAQHAATHHRPCPEQAQSTARLTAWTSTAEQEPCRRGHQTRGACALSDHS